MKTIQYLAALLTPHILASASPVSTSDNVCGAASGISDSRAQQVKSAFQSAKLVPDLVNSINPTVDFKVAYGSKQMDLGTRYIVTETLQSPSYSFDPESGYDQTTTKYTIIYADPDAPGPSLPLLRSFLHYLAYDVQPNCVSNQSPKTLAPYMPLTPLSLAAHRYAYLVLRQPAGKFVPDINPVQLVGRAPFDVQAFITRNNLQLVGGNYMLEGLAPGQLANVPFATENGLGYVGPKNGTAEPLNGLVGSLL